MNEWSEMLQEEVKDEKGLDSQNGRPGESHITGLAQCSVVD